MTRTVQLARAAMDRFAKQDQGGLSSCTLAEQAAKKFSEAIYDEFEASTTRLISSGKIFG
ncbi:MAG: hypothetical protein JW850_23240 [Thermoflexales bacterium]|nr:hypothetical protein [Thermoflexales bacterium]